MNETLSVEKQKLLNILTLVREARKELRGEKD